jgi:hypothetical protein
MDTPEKRVWGERRPKDTVTSQIIFVFTLTHLKTFTWQNLHWPRVSVKKNIYTLQQNKFKCKKFERVRCKWFTLTLDLHTVCIYGYWHFHAQFWCIRIHPLMDDTSLGLGFSSALRLRFVVCVFLSLPHVLSRTRGTGSVLMLAEIRARRGPDRVYPNRRSRVCVKIR